MLTLKVTNVNKGFGAGSVMPAAGPVGTSNTVVTNVTLQVFDTEGVSGALNLVFQSDNDDYKLGDVYAINAAK